MDGMERKKKKEKKEGKGFLVAGLLGTLMEETLWHRKKGSSAERTVSNVFITQQLIVQKKKSPYRFGKIFSHS